MCTITSLRYPRRLSPQRRAQISPAGSTTSFPPPDLHSPFDIASQGQRATFEQYVASQVPMGYRWVLACAVLLFTCTSARAQSAPVNPPPEASKTGYVGGAVCRTCHPNVWLNFYKNPHYKSVASGKEPPELTGCEGCHGPGKAHVEARGGKATIIAFSELGPKQILDNCLRCHAKDFTRSEIRRSQHTLTDVVCTNCHSIHRSQTQKFLLAKTQANLCYDCHAPVRAQFN